MNNWWKVIKKNIHILILYIYLFYNTISLVDCGHFVRQIKRENTNFFYILHSQTNFICTMKTFPVRKCTQTILGLFLRSLFCQSFDSLLVCLQAQIHPAQSQQQDRGDAERFSTQSRFTWKQYKTMVRNTSIRSVELHSQKILERMRLWEGFQIYFKWC